MKQAGLNPLPLQTGAEVIVSGPQTHDGLLFDRQAEAQSARTLELVNEMRANLAKFRNSDHPDEVLARTWHDELLWFGPRGIGSTYAICRY